MDSKEIKRGCKHLLKAILPQKAIIFYKYIRQFPVQEQNKKEYTKNMLTDAFLRSTETGEKYFDFHGIYLPDIRNNVRYMNTFLWIIEDSFLFYLYFNDNYDKNVVQIMDLFMAEGPYGYTDNQTSFDVTVKKHDIVIDAGAWIGDFSAYAAHKGGIVYAFEPAEESYKFLQKTAALNSPAKIIPVKSGLAASEKDALLIKTAHNSGGNHILDSSGSGTSQRRTSRKAVENITLTSIDAFVEKQGLERVDFIKADIEGAEREMLRGARATLRRFAPKLAICTYHLPDDPEVLEHIILAANPAYKIIQLRRKLFACVPGK